MSKEECIFSSIDNALHGMDGIVMIDSIAEDANVTPSDVVALLRKYEAKGSIETGPSGMNGTYIKVINDSFFGEIQSK